MSIDFDKYSMIRFILPMIVGMGVANFCIQWVEKPSLVSLVLLILSFLCVLLFFWKKKGGAFVVSAMSLSFFLGAFLFVGRYKDVEQGIGSQTTNIRGVLISTPEEKAKSVALNLEQENGTKILLYVQKSDEAKALCIGDTILAKPLHLNLTSPAQSDSDDEFLSYRRHLFYNGTCATAYALTSDWQAVRGTRSSTIYRLQDTLHAIYSERILDSESRSIVEAMTIGRKETLSKSMRQQYSSAGVSHVLALSGYHVGMLFLVLHLLSLYELMPIRIRTVIQVLIIAAMWCYALIAGMPPSLTRATTMLTILTVCNIVRRSHVPLVSCALTAAIMLCYNPFMLMDVGFQLSFVSVVAISLTMDRLTDLCPFNNFVMCGIWNIVMISLVCSVFTAPLVAYHFQAVPLLSVLTNLAITPFVYCVMWGSVLWWITMWSDAVNAFITHCLSFLIHGMNSIVAQISSLSFSTISYTPTLIDVVLLYVVILFSTILLHAPNSKSIIRLLVSIIVVLVVMIVETL